MPTDTLSAPQIEAAVDATAALLGLPLDPAHRPGVLTYYALAAQMAQVVLAVPLSAHDETGALFRPVEPGAHDGQR